jgi:hypothetical protein
MRAKQHPPASRAGGSSPDIRRRFAGDQNATGNGRRSNECPLLPRLAGAPSRSRIGYRRPSGFAATNTSGAAIASRDTGRMQVRVEPSRRGIRWQFPCCTSGARGRDMSIGRTSEACALMDRAGASWSSSRAQALSSTFCDACHKKPVRRDGGPQNPHQHPHVGSPKKKPARVLKGRTLGVY